MLWAKTLPFQRHLRRRPSHLSYNFRPWDHIVDRAAAYGIRVHLTLAGQPVPAFASGRRRQDQYKPNARHFAQWARTVAKHFKGRVDRYSIWNEPNHKAWLEPVRSQARLYRKLYISGRKAIKRADRRAKVFIAETAPFSKSPRVATRPLKFLRQLTCANRRYRPRRRCAALRADGYAHHPYEFTRHPRRPPRRFNTRDDVPLASLGRLTRALDRLRRARLLIGPRGRKLNLYLHEYGYFNSGRGKIFPQSTRARYLVGGFTIAQRNRRVRTQLQYGLVTPPPHLPSAFFDLSLVTLGGGRMVPFRALRAWAVRKVRQHRIKRPPRKPLRLPRRRG
jgi:hypothetical protein